MTANKLVQTLLEEIDDDKRFAVIIVLRNPSDPETLLVRREFPPEEGKWASPGGHCNEGEPVMDAAKRELEEETHLTPDELIHLTTEKAADKAQADAGGKVHYFYAVVEKEDKPRAGDDAEKIKWVKVSDCKDLAFDCQVQIKAAAKKAFNTKEIEESRAEGKYGREGLLIVFEGIDGSGKSTQVRRLNRWLFKQGLKVKTTKWNSSEILTDALFRAKKRKELSPILFSLMHAADLTWRYENVIEPALKKGKVVLCDRYYYTSYVRDSIRGVNERILDYIYEDWRAPDIIFYCKVPVRIAVERLLRDKGVYYYSAGRDAGYTGSKEECAMQYETDMDKVYKRLFSKEPSVVEIDTERPIEEIAEQIRGLIKRRFHIG